MKIRITGKALSKAQVGQQTGEPISIKDKTSGIIYTKDHPDWERIKKENAELNAMGAETAGAVAAHFASKNITAPVVPTSVPSTTASTVKPIGQPMQEPAKVDLSGFKPPVVAGYQEEPLVAPVDPLEPFLIPQE